MTKHTAAHLDGRIATYLRHLKTALAGAPQQEREAILGGIIEHIDRELDAGADPEQILTDLGPVEDVAADYTQPASRAPAWYRDLSIWSLIAGIASAVYFALPILTTACTVAALITGTMALRRQPTRGQRTRAIIGIAIAALVALILAAASMAVFNATTG